MKKKSKPEDPYPNITALGVSVMQTEHGTPYVPNKELTKALRKCKIAAKFDKFFGCQTQIMEGCYPWDVEAVLERIRTGNLTGTQSAIGWD